MLYKQRILLFQENKSPWQLHICLGSYCWINSIPPFCITRCSACLTFPQLPRIRSPSRLSASSGPSLLSLPPNSLLVSVPLLHDPVSRSLLPEFSHLTFAVSLLFFYPLSRRAVTDADAWFCFHLWLGSNDSHLKWPRSNIILSAWFQPIRTECGVRGQWYQELKQTDRQTKQDLQSISVCHVWHGFLWGFVLWVYTLAGWVCSEKGGCLCCMG